MTTNNIDDKPLIACFEQFARLQHRSSQPSPAKRFHCPIEQQNASLSQESRKLLMKEKYRQSSRNPLPLP